MHGGPRKTQRLLFASSMLSLGWAPWWCMCTAKGTCVGVLVVSRALVGRGWVASTKQHWWG